ncbi:MAG: cysteine synthase family protein, partial [Anaerolineaceae bacterium]|nr:cysteine synthase family protein [Anaerolineaceae bacterium]
MAYLNELDYLVAEDHPRLDYAENILETIGNTPLVRLSRVNDPAISALVLAKLEMFNPGGSIKDRVGLAMIEDAEQQGRLQPGGTIVESTSGNTGAGLALAAIQKGYQCVFVIPDKISHQKIAFLEALGARVVITPSSVPADDPRSCYNVAAQIVAETPNSCLANQYHNPANPQTHVDWTGPEIWRQTAGSIDVVVCGMGTGGTISGLGRYFKSKNPEIKVVGVDVRGSLLMESWQQG